MDRTMVKGCVLCFREIHNHHERYLVQGKRKFDVFQELRSLPFNLKSTSSFICKGCLNNLKKRSSLIGQLKELDNSLEKVHADKIEPELKRSASESNESFTTPKKLRSAAPEIELVHGRFSPVQKPINDHNTQGKIIKGTETGLKKTNVSVRVEWPSKDSKRKLPEELESLGKMLVRGTYKQIARAAWKNSSIRKELTEVMARDVEKEASHLSSKKEPSCLRKTDKESMLSFSMEKLSDEIKDRAPLFYSLLSAACINSRSRANKSSGNTDFGAVAMAAAVCLRNRSRYMIAAQLLVTIFMYHSNWLSSIARLSTLRLAVSHTYLYKKLDEFGKEHTKSITDAVTNQGQYMAQEAVTSASMDPVEPRASTESQANPPPCRETIHKPDVGRKITFDNLDYRQEVHHMTEEHQNIDKHYVTAMSTENRVYGHHLSDKSPDRGVLDMENGKCLPSVQDNARQRDNYITLAERIISSNIPCLYPLSDVSTPHIPHQYSQEMKNVSDTTFLGMIYENENDADGILNILRSLHNYVPYSGDDEDRKYGEQGIVGDQLSVERAVNGHMSLANGFTPEERAEGLHFEVADWHAGNKFLDVAFTHMYNVSSAVDKCTMFSDRTLINRRNVKGDVSAAANPCRRFFPAGN
ncbi:hypothetical protein OS493_033663 [Desmophyllum pertusum]|uniref:Uncharacterized protein n=1 Tax=Desmophyllum pertusum TaxID=174260 RepID=A0A9X0D771_9CNID|nr:hypothetical protein OS493_033663 [Desmophyllum pertusum]